MFSNILKIHLYEAKHSVYFPVCTTRQDQWKEMIEVLTHLIDSRVDDTMSA